MDAELPTSGTGTDNLDATDQLPVKMCSRCSVQSQTAGGFCPNCAARAVTWRATGAPGGRRHVCSTVEEAQIAALNWKRDMLEEVVRDEDLLRKLPASHLNDVRTLMMKRCKTDRGSAAVEFALILPILMMLVFATISFGFLFAQDLALSNSARQTARYGVVKDRTCDSLVTEAKDSAKPLVTLATADIVVKRGTTAAAATNICFTAEPWTKPCEGSATGDNIYVSLNYTADVLVPVIPGMGSTKGLDGVGVFRCEWSEATP